MLIGVGASLESVRYISIRDTPDEWASAMATTPWDATLAIGVCRTSIATG
jgi:hypothetical protein